MGSSRCCSRSSCQGLAVATLTYDYATSTAVVGPLALPPVPQAYDLCEVHARGLTAPRGWQLVRHDGPLAPPPGPPDDLAALAEAVQERPPAAWAAAASAAPGRGHLWLVPPS